jgi:hypothetical protein
MRRPLECRRVETVPYSLILTGAWNPILSATDALVADRRGRLRDSIRFYQDLGIFRRIVLADGTLRDSDRARLTAEFAGVEIPALTTHPHGPFAGPSYLEALLYAEVLAAGVVADDDAIWVKATGGYQVKNLMAILGVAKREGSCGLCFLHQSPLRLRRRFAMSAFFLLDGAGLNGFLRHVSASLERTRQEPLESLLLEFFATRPTKTVRAPYPRIDAFFATTGLRSDSLRLLPNWVAWRTLSAMGIYALSIPRGA